MSDVINKATRNDIFDALRLERVSFAGQFNDVDFLTRLYNLQLLPSHDGRYKDAAGDIWQHTVNNDDFEFDWVFLDERFNLVGCGDEQFLHFLAETVHPVVRPNRDEASKIVALYNEQLRRNGWELVEVDGIAGRPRYEGRRIASSQTFVAEAKRVANSLDADWMHKEILRAEHAIDSDPDLAIGTAKELVESCCKTLLGKLGVEVPKDLDFPSLTKKTTKALKLTREDIPDSAKGAEIVRVLLNNLASITKGMNELRNLYGTGHGRDGQHKGLEPRHARLAVTTAAAFVVFVADTYHDRLNRNHSAVR